MATIKKLPQHVINKLKAGEIVERPASVVKELVENSLDAGADRIVVEMKDGGKELIRVEDDGAGMSKDDLELTIERYSTSKIADERDLEQIASYGFRGEALASIAEVSLFRIQSLSSNDEQHVAYELYKSPQESTLKEVPFARNHGTIVYVEDLFHNIPARQKFLKTAATERRHINKMFLQYALIHYGKHWKLIQNGNVKRNVQPADSLLARIQALYKAERHEHMKPISYQDEQLELYGVVSDAALHFSRPKYMSLFVNGRPVNDKLVKKAVLDAYRKQIVPGTYPFVVLFIDLDPSQVDVNVHPRKSEVTFLDPGSMFAQIKQTVQDAIGATKVNFASFKKNPVQTRTTRASHAKRSRKNELSGQSSIDFEQSASNRVSTGRPVDNHQPVTTTVDQTEVEIVGQLRDSYIVLESADAIYYVDQHALAERITFEKMRTNVAEEGLQQEPLLQPVTAPVPDDVDLTPTLTALQEVGFDISEFGEQKVIVHAVPRVFVAYKMDINLLLQQVWGVEYQDISFDLLLDEILGMKACKASIKAGQPLTKQEMKQLIEDGMRYIDGMFVCQHGRPSVVKVEKENIEGLFDR